MVRMSTIDRKQAPWHLRWFYAATSRMFGKELTPVKLQARVPRVVWAAILVEACLSGRRQVSLRHIQLGRIRAAAHRVSVLSGHQLCRGQKGWSHRREASGGFGH